MRNILSIYLDRILLGTAMFFASHSILALNLDQYPRLKEATAPLVSKGIYSQAELNQVFAGVELREEVIKRKANAAEKVLTWGRGGRRGTGYRGIFLQADRIEQGAEYWRANKTLMDKATVELGLDGSMIAAIIGVETKFGQNKGSHLVLESIATHANRGSKLQFGQLPIFLTLVKQGHLPIDVKGSYSGALGIPQFISSSYRHQWRSDQPVMQKVSPVDSAAAQALDAMAVTKINSRVKPDTTVAALKGYLRDAPENVAADTAVGVFKFLDENDEAEYFLGYYNFYAIMRYNHSSLYARAVYELSTAIARAY